MKVNTFIFMGRPGSGKGVQSEMLAQKLGLPIFSTGNRVREVAKLDTDLGRKIREVSESGELTPFWFASYLFQEALFKLKDGEGIIFEGVGRKEPEARLFNEIEEWLGNEFRIFHLNVSEESARKRLMLRGEKEGRADDAPERIPVRFQKFQEETQAALNFFRSVGKVIEIDGEPLPDAVFAQVVAEIEKL